MSRQPWFKFYPSDWRSDPALRMCSLAARGLWMEVIGIMHEAVPRGHLLIAGRPVPPEKLAALVGISPEEAVKLFTELEEAGVFSRKRNGVVFSRRMERDEEKARKNRENGAQGGNPSLGNGKKKEGSVNPQDKPQNPEPSNQELDTSCVSDDTQLGEAGLEACLRKAAGWEVHPNPMLAVTGPITALLANGADLALDVLPVIRALAPRCRRPNWKYFVEAIAGARDARLAASATIIPINAQIARNSHGTYRQKPSRDESFAAIDAAIDELERRQRT